VYVTVNNISSGIEGTIQLSKSLQSPLTVQEDVTNGSWSALNLATIAIGALSSARIQLWERCNHA
jgi:hypothetical protein